MKILWISGRRLGHDLASQTEHKLSNHLSSLGLEVDLLSPGSAENENYKHIRINDLKLQGLTTLSGARKVGNFIRKENMSDYDLVLVDWRFIVPLKSFLVKLSTPWAIIDRGPPVTPGMFNRLQKWFWKKSWKIANKHARAGFVVSKRHISFVRSLTHFQGALHVIKAGAEPNPNNLNEDRPIKPIKIAYVGRLDIRRGIMKIESMIRELENRGIEYNLIIHGEGDLSADIAELAESNDKIIFYGKTSHEEVELTLSTCHIGIMPMPDIPVWRISSPLKLAEYLAAGLIIIGPRHPGNEIQSEGTWNLLAERDWEIYAADRISMLDKKTWEIMRDDAIESSKLLEWKKISQELKTTLEDMV